jgi:hypothetical protein
MPRSSPYSARCNARYGSIGGARGGSNGNSQPSPERHCSQLGSLVLVAFSTRWTHSGSTPVTVLLTKTSVAGVLLTKDCCGVRIRRSCRSGRWVDELDAADIRHTRASRRTASMSRRVPIRGSAFRAVHNLGFRDRNDEFLCRECARASCKICTALGQTLGGWEHTQARARYLPVGSTSTATPTRHGRGGGSRGAGRGPEKKYVLQPIEVLCGIPYTL